ncbi:MAG: CAP domain-containing protein [Persicimonas sp.]
MFARTVQIRLLTLLSIAALLLIAGCGEDDEGRGGGVPASTTCTAPDCDAKIGAVVDQTNQARSQQRDCGEHGSMDAAASLTADAALHEAAQAHANDMAANDFFSHTGSDGSQFFERIESAGYEGQPVGENIAGGRTTAEQVVSGWMQSDGHCRNIMNASATKIGVGFAEGGSYGTVWVQVFGR